MKRYIVLLVIAFSLSALFTSCRKASTGPENLQEPKRDGGIIITDAEGVRWDVTHAQEKYGMRGEQFQYGLGPNAITPINDPQFLSPGDEGYPRDTDTFMVLGVSIKGDSRAYPMVILGRHEVVNDEFGNQPVAITN